MCRHTLILERYAGVAVMRFSVTSPYYTVHYFFLIEEQATLISLPASVVSPKPFSGCYHCMIPHIPGNAPRRLFCRDAVVHTTVLSMTSPCLRAASQHCGWFDVGWKWRCGWQGCHTWKKICQTCIRVMRHVIFLTWMRPAFSIGPAQTRPFTWKVKIVEVKKCPKKGSIILCHRDWWEITNFCDWQIKAAQVLHKLWPNGFSCDLNVTQNCLDEWSTFQGRL